MGAEAKPEASTRMEIEEKLKEKKAARAEDWRERIGTRTVLDVMAIAKTVEEGAAEVEVAVAEVTTEAEAVQEKENLRETTRDHHKETKDLRKSESLKNQSKPNLFKLLNK